MTSPPFDPRPITLEGSLVRLEPLAPRHVEGMFEAGRDPAVWEHLARGPFASLDDVRTWMASIASEVDAARQIAFAIVRRSDGIWNGAPAGTDRVDWSKAMFAAVTWTADPPGWGDAPASLGAALGGGVVDGAGA
jgi:hypothetical protein